MLKSIKFRLGAAIVIGVVVLAVVQLLVFTLVVKKQVVEQLRPQAIAHVQVLAASADRSPSGMQPLLQRLSTIEGLEWAVVFGTNGVLMADLNQHMSREGSAPTGPVSRFEDGVLVAEAPFRTGYVQIGIRPGAGNASQEALNYLGFAAATLILLSLVAGALFGNAFGDRVVAIRNVAVALAAGSLDPPQLESVGDDELGELGTAMHDLVKRLRGLRSNVERVSTGDLTVTVMDDGDLGQALGLMVANQRELVMRIARTSDAMDSASKEILGSSQTQEANATQQAAVVEQIVRTMQTVSRNAEQVAVSADQVLDLAERADGNNRAINERIVALKRHANRIGEVLEVITEIAHKSEILALNAALEGTRAGEAGRGFSLVAGQMGKLSEDVLAAVEDIQELTRDIDDATSATVTAAQQASSGSSATASAAREIRKVVQQQHAGSQQVSRGLGEISSSIHEASSASRQSASEAGELAILAEQLLSLVQRFTLR